MATQLITAEEAAERLGVPEKAVYREARAGRLPGTVRIGRRRLRFDPVALEQFIRDGGTQNGQSAGRAD
jgi:excisionase family DNA binding protein